MSVEQNGVDSSLGREGVTSTDADINTLNCVISKTLNFGPPIYGPLPHALTPVKPYLSQGNWMPAAEIHSF